MKIRENEFNSAMINQYIDQHPLQRVRLLQKSVVTKNIINSIIKEDNKSTFILVAAISIIAPQEKVELFSALLNSTMNISNAEALEIFIRTSTLLEPLVTLDLLEELKQIFKVGKAEERGFIYDEKKDTYSFNSNAFVKYFKKRCNVRTIKDGRLFLYNKNGYYSELSEVELGKIIRSVMHEGLLNSWKSTREQEIVKALKREAEIVNDINFEKNEINLKNGIFNLETFELLPHSPMHLSTIQLPIKYNPNADAPNFMQFLRDITLNDDELITVLKEILGYLLSSETKAERAFFFYGGGSNGKSTLSNLIIELIGEENISSIPLSEFSKPFGLEGIINKSVNIAAENEKTCKTLNTENFKAIVSGDTISINLKYRPIVSYTPHCKLVFLVNQLPDSADVTNGFFRRVMIIPFNNYFEKDNKDVDMKEKLFDELSGILNWCIEGLKRLRKNNYNFSHCDAIERCFKNYYLEQNPVVEFFEEHIKVEKDKRTKQSEFYKKYLQWLQLQGIDDKGTKSNQIFWKNFKIVLGNKHIKIDKKKVNGIVYFEGIEIVGLEDTQYPVLVDNNIQF